MYVLPDLLHRLVLVQTSGIPDRSRGQPIHQNGEHLFRYPYFSLEFFLVSKNPLLPFPPAPTK
jgi:hypothetical protein